MAAALLLSAAADAAGAPLLSPVTTRAGVRSQSALSGIARVQTLALDHTALDDLRGRTSAVLSSFPLGGARTADIEVTRFDPFTPGARVEVMEADGPHQIALPDAAYFVGRVAGEPQSRVLLIAGRDAVHGFVAAADGVFPFGPDAGGIHRTYALADVDAGIHPPPGEFCANDLDAELVHVPAAEAMARTAPPVAATGSTLQQADVAIDTDREFRLKFTTDQGALDYLSSLLAAATAIYERDVAVRLRFSYIRLWGASPADPWNATDPSSSLSEVRSYWLNSANNMDAIAGSHDLVHFISGKSVQGGVAYLDVLCNRSYGFGVSQVYGNFNLAMPSQIWDVLVVTHELGHNFGSPHSHCYNPPLDHCYNQEAGCYAGTAEASRGTIMSYCHLLSGLSAIDLQFGSVVSAEIGASVSGAACLATVAGASTTSSTTSTSTSTTSTSTTTSSSIVPPTSPAGPGSTTSTVSTDSTTSTTDVSAPTDPTDPTDPTGPTDPSIGDDDGDGVPDDIDECDTPPGDMVDAVGCSVCPCDGPDDVTAWRSHTAYLKCIKTEIKRRVAEGTLPRRDSRGMLLRARGATCGRAQLTRCCIYRGDSSKGHCKIMKVDICDNLDAGDDVGSGSCTPNPCDF